MASYSYSCEPKRSSAYSDDIRWRIIWQKEVLKLTDKEVAANLCISPSTVQRIIKLFKTTGGISKRSYRSEQAHRSITKPVEFFIVDLLLEKPGIYLREVQFELETQLGLAVSAGCLCKSLHKVVFTHQRLSKYAIQRSDCLRARFTQDVFL